MIIPLGGDDYGSGSFNVTIPIRRNTVSFNLSIINDNIFEGTETFTLTIESFSLPSKVLLQTDCMLMVTIVDNDGELYIFETIFTYV